MVVINIKRFGFAYGSMCAILYLGCVFVMAILGKERAVIFFNSLMHGIDTSSIIRTNMPAWEMFIGIIEVFILGWLAGATIASIYNYSCSRIEIK